MMQLYFIRHGQSTNNANWDDNSENYERTSDPKLTDLGVYQAKALANFVASSHSSNGDNGNGVNSHSICFTHLYSSLMIRSIQTGTILSETLDIPLFGLQEAHEIGGIYLETLVDGIPQISSEFGVTPAFLREHYPALKLHDPIPEKGWWQGGIEPVTAPLLRADTVLNLLKECHLGTNDKVAVVTHGGFFNTMARTIFNIRPEEPDNRNLSTWFAYCNCAVSRFDFVNDRVVWVYHNRTDFMKDELVTC
jgi:2,3-bisphosphoglycerate-dependent phosphoglycerate mutase